MNSPREKWVAIAGVTVLSLVALAGFAVAIWAAWLFHDMPDASDLADYHPPTATRAYAWDGTLIGEFSRERRIFVPYDNIPPQLAEAFLAMTRGQDSLIIDVEPTPQAAAATRIAIGKLELIVLAASAEELAEHAKQLAEIDKASKGATVWRKLEMV